eukprot:gene20517-27309_t
MLELKGELAEVIDSLEHNDASALLEIAAGPLNPDLIPQEEGSGIVVAGKYEKKATRFIFKKAHLSLEDFRIFKVNLETQSSKNGQLVAVSHHEGKNPYDSLDPMGLGNGPTKRKPLGEMESLCDGVEVFNIAKLSRIKSMSLRHNMCVCKADSRDEVYILEADLADSKDEVYILEADLVGRTIVMRNKNDEIVAVAALSNKAMMMKVALGSGSETVVDVAPGVDWTAVCAIMMGVQQALIQPPNQLVTKSPSSSDPQALSTFPFKSARPSELPQSLMPLRPHSVTQ